MVSREAIVNAANAQGFVAVGFTDAAPFQEHRQMLAERQEEYSWAEAVGLNLMDGTDPATILPEAKSIIVVIENYFSQAFPRSMEGRFGRCYIDDDRVTRDGLVPRIKAFRNFLRENGIQSKVPFNLPHRVAAARAGLGTFGKNCLFYPHHAMRGSSWNLPIAFVVDHEFSPDTPTMGIGCPDWCRNACIAACPTRALKGNGTIDPRKCISFLSYFCDGLTPMDMREPMGMFVYGCDRCQEVCPRNQGWLARELPMNERAAAKADFFDLRALLHMDEEYFQNNVWPHMFYMASGDIWRWKMNVARAMGNSRDPDYIPDLVRAFQENTDERITAMAVWAIGRIGGKPARNALQGLRNENMTDTVNEELGLALEAA